MANPNYNQSYPASVPESAPLPEGWEMLIDKNTGWPFFVDHINHRTTWQDPRVQPAYNQGFHEHTPAPQMAQQTKRGIREIPVIHEGGQRRTQSPVRPFQYHDHEMPGNSPSADSPLRCQSPGSQHTKVREIPIIRESSNSPRMSPQPQTMWGMPHENHQAHTPPRQGIPQHVGRSDGQWAGRVGSPTSQNRQVPIFTQERSYSPSFQHTAGYRASPQHHHGGPMYQSPPPQEPPYSSAPRYTSTKEVPISVGDPHPRQSQSTRPPASTSTGQATDHTTTDGGGNRQNIHVSAEEPASAPASTEKDHLPAPEQQKPTRTPSPAPANLTPLEIVQQILAEAESYQREVECFAGVKKDKEYLLIEEMLTRLLEKLDRIDSEGKDEIRQVRRQGVKTVQAALDQLELKVFANSIDLPADALEGDKSAQQQNQSQNQNPSSEQMSAGSSNTEQPNMETDSQKLNHTPSKKPGDASHVTEMMLESEIRC